MEIKELIREGSVDGTENVALPHRFTTILSKLKEYDLNSIICDQNILDEIFPTDCMSKIGNKIKENFEIEDRQPLDIYIGFLKKLILLGIKERDIKFIYIFYSIIERIGFTLEDLNYCDFLRENGHLIAAQQIISAFVCNLDLRIDKIDILGNDSKSDFENYSQLIEEENLMVLNQLLKTSYMAIYRKFDPAIFCIIINCSKYDPDLYFDKTSRLNDPLIIHLFLSFIPRENLERHINSKIITNKWLAIELIRKILDIPGGKCSSEEKNLGKIILDQLYELNYQFFIKTCEVFSSSLEFNKIFALFLAKLPTEKLEIVLKNTLEVKISSSYITQREALFEEFYHNATQEHNKIFGFYFYSEWEKLIDLHSNPETSILPELIVTDFPRHILCYVINEFTLKDIVESISSIILTLRTCNTNWYLDSLQFRKDVILHLSRLYMFSHAFRDMKINDTTLSVKFENLLKIPFLLDIFNEKIITKSVDQIKQNFNFINNTPGSCVKLQEETEFHKFV